MRIVAAAFAALLTACSTPVPRFQEQPSTSTEVDGFTIETFRDSSEVYSRITSTHFMVAAETNRRVLLAGTRKNTPGCVIDPASVHYGGITMSAVLDCEGP